MNDNTIKNDERLAALLAAAADRPVHRRYAQSLIDWYDNGETDGTEPDPFTTRLSVPAEQAIRREVDIAYRRPDLTGPLVGGYHIYRRDARRKAARRGDGLSDLRNILPL
jgi:hypothetical protein